MPDNQQLSGTQRGVLIGAAGGLAVTLLLLAAGPSLGVISAIPAENAERLHLFAVSALILGLWLAVCVAKLARHRFFSESDIDGAPAGQSHRADILQAKLQNTLEQAVLAFIAYAVWFSIAPSHWGIMPIFASLVFSVGRILFLFGYARGAQARALGFALTFYPSCGMLLMCSYAVLRSYW